MASPLIAKYQPKQTTTSSHKSNLAVVKAAQKGGKRGNK
jgi:hypothetical protein